MNWCKPEKRACSTFAPKRSGAATAGRQEHAEEALPADPGHEGP